MNPDDLPNRRQSTTLNPDLSGGTTVNELEYTEDMEVTDDEVDESLLRAMACDLTPLEERGPDWKNKKRLATLQLPREIPEGRKSEKIGGRK